MDWPDRHHLNAVVGWLELGNLHEARVDFERLSESCRTSPDVLAVEWRLLAAEQQWDAAARSAITWVNAAPEAPEAWIQRSFALHELRRTQEAWDALLPAATRFPGVGTIAYNLACYACQLEQLETARIWFRRAMETFKDAGERRHWITAALRDPDLAPLWQEIREGKLS